MSSVIAFEPRRFESAAPYYLEGRPRYADLLIRRVSNLLGFDGSQKLLDLGTGPGQLAMAFAPFVGAVTAIDPELEMLRIARRQARDAGLRINLVEGSSYTLGDRMGRFDIVTIGRAFHWTDRRATLQTLDRLVEPRGAVALFSTAHPELSANEWVKDFDALRDIHGERNSHRQVMRSPDWIPHEAILLDSPFPALERISVIERRATPLEHFVTRILSLATTSPGRIGTSADAVSRTLRDGLSKYAVNGFIHEVVESEALLAFRL